MTDYTHKNLKSVDDSAPKFGMDGIEARFATGALACTQTGLSYQRYEPNIRVPFGHQHGEQEEIYVIVSGGGRVKIEDDVVELKQWDALRVGPGTMRGFESGPDGLEMVAFGAPRTGPGEADMVQDWWSG